jgi:mRNA interferase MazF
MAYDAGDVVLVPFPYRDRLAEQARPGVVLSSQAYNQHGDLILAAITSQPPRFDTDYALVDWKSAGLQFASTARMLLATVSVARVLFQIGHLSERDWVEVKTRLFGVFSK